VDRFVAHADSASLLVLAWLVLAWLAIICPS